MVDRANLFVQRNDLIAAEKDVKAALATNANSPAAIYVDALISIRRGDFQKADADVTKLRPIMDRLPDAYLIGGIVKYNLNQLEQAEAYLTRYIAAQGRARLTRSRRFPLRQIILTAFAISIRSP